MGSPLTRTATSAATRASAGTPHYLNKTGGRRPPASRAAARRCWSSALQATQPWVPAQAATRSCERDRMLANSSVGSATRRRDCGRALTREGCAMLTELEEAIACLEHSPARLELGRALADYGGALRRANRRADA